MTFEVWLKGPNDANPVRQLRTEFGTGFFVRSDAGFFLVTAGHVATKLAGGSRITVLGADGKAHELPLDAFVQGPIEWATHPNADVAALPLRPNSADIQRFLDQRAVPLDMFAPDLVAPPIDRELTVVGFPFGLGISVNNFSPLVLRSLPASGILAPARGVPFSFFTLERPGVGGYSGAPVFDLGYHFFGAGGTGVQSNYGPTRIVGVLQGTLFDPTGGKLAVVVPAHFVVQLLRGVG